MKLLDIYKKKQGNINNELKKLRLAKLANNNISKSDLVNIKRFNAFPIKHLRQIAKLRNISTNLSKSDIIYALICSKPIINEEKYIFDNVNEVLSKTNDVRLLLSIVSLYVNKKKRDSIRKRLYEIGNTRNIDRKLKNRLLKELESMSIHLKSIQKRMISAYRDDKYANIHDIEYIFGDIDNYYAPVLSSSLSNNGYQRYHFRGDPMRNMSVKEYLNEI